MLKMANYLPLTFLSRKLDVIKATEIQQSTDSSGVPHTAEETGVCMCACVYARVWWGEEKQRWKTRGEQQRQSNLMV